MLINSYDEIQKQLAAQGNFLVCCLLNTSRTLSHEVNAHTLTLTHTHRYDAEERRTRQERQVEVLQSPYMDSFSGLA